MQQQRNTIEMDLTGFNWTSLKAHREWLLNYHNIESATLVQFIDELWLDRPKMYWSMIHDQKQWLSTIADSTATELLNFLEVIQDRAVNSEQVPLDLINGQYTPVKKQKPKHLKLVVSNYFRPLERIDQPCKPDPVLTLV